jgi:SAM-dependent methyltransferase
MKIAYLLPRVVRHFLPERLTRFLLLRSLIIKPGLETVDAAAAIDRYLQVLRARQEQLAGKRVLVFGYGGRLGIGSGLLDAGAGHVTLWDKYAGPDDDHSAWPLTEQREMLGPQEARSRQEAGRLESVQADIRELQPSDPGQQYDIVVSNSVYEHLEDPHGSTQALARWTKPTGLHIHFVDLRDHYFKYPFEMLRFSEATWRRWLNPTSNHNRLRTWDYRRVFEASFREVQFEVLQRDEAGFREAEPHIRAEFKSGDTETDSVTLLRVVASMPRARGVGHGND